MSEHTPGPWKVIDGESSGGWDEPGEYEYRVITEDPEPRPNNILASFWDSEFGYEARANAKLIASAPTLKAENERLKAVNAEMLRALRMVRNELPECNCDEGYTSRDLTDPNCCFHNWYDDRYVTIISDAIEKAE